MGSSDETIERRRLPEVFERGPIQVAVSAPGAAPSFLGRVSLALAQGVGHEFGTLHEWLAEPGTGALLRIPGEDFRKSLSQTVLESEVLDLLRDGKHGQARARFEALRQLCEASWSA